MIGRSSNHIGAPVFFFNDTATTEIYTLSLHDALPICTPLLHFHRSVSGAGARTLPALHLLSKGIEQSLLQRSEEHTSELQSRQYLVCRLLLEKKKKCLQILTYQQIKRNLAYPQYSCLP